MSEKRFHYLINEKGNLQEEAKTFFKERFCREVEALLNFAGTESELRLLGSVLSATIQDMISKRVAESKSK